MQTPEQDENQPVEQDDAALEAEAFLADTVADEDDSSDDEDTQPDSETASDGEGQDADDDDDDDDDDDAHEDDEPQPNLAAASELESLVAFIAARLVHEPETVEVTSEFRGGTVYISLRVPESEMGRVIGREGRTAKAIRTLVSIAGSRHNVHARLDIEG